MQQTAAPIAQAEYLRLRDAAPFLGISPAHLQTLLRRGEAPPSTRLGRARLFSVQTLREFMRVREQ
jgi:predicted DNA-binding transcriptional regulator AlpA